MANEKTLVGRHTWEHDVVTWPAPMDYEPWLGEVCQGQELREDRAREFYAAQWEPSSCRQYLMFNKGFVRPARAPKSRVVVLDAAAIDRRFALCLWRECGKLATRKMTPDARALVKSMSDRMAEKLGIIG